jgi:tRNA-dihydrouridine synthase C
MRLGWESIDSIDENAVMAAEGGASWLTIHGRTRFAGYAPPIFWGPIGRVRERLKIPVVANGDIWSIADFRRCREITGCRHFMLGRGALANPDLPRRVAVELGLTSASAEHEQVWQTDWHSLISRLAELTRDITPDAATSGGRRYKQWLKLAATHGSFAHFDLVKQTKTAEELIGILKSLDF